MFTEFCEVNGIKHVKTRQRWAQGNGEVEWKHSSIMKRIKIAQAEGLDWKWELWKYVTSYRSLEHATARKSPAELSFNWKMRGELSDIRVTDTTTGLRASKRCLRVFVIMY